MPTYDDVCSRVQRGAELLDSHSPGWEKELDLEKLELQSTENDVLGQVFGSFTVGADLLRPYEERMHSAGFDIDLDLAYRLAEEKHDKLDAGDHFENDYWDMLNEAWTQEVESRR
jgi:hypothetical protein